MSVIYSESRKTEQVTMKANFIHTWSVKSAFVLKKKISLDIKVSVNLAFFFRKLGYFRLKKSPIFSKNAKFMLTLMSKEKLNFLLQIQILHFKYVWNLPSLSLARFFLIQNELRTICYVVHTDWGQGFCTFYRNNFL